MEALQAELLFEMDLELDRGAIQQVGVTSRGTRLVAYIRGGAFAGPRVRGDVLPGGGDWLLIRPDGVREPDVRLTLRADDGALIYMAYRAIFRIAPELLQRVLQGETLDPSTYYLRSQPLFETGAEKYRWLNELVTIGVGAPTSTGLKYAIYTIL